MMENVLVTGILLNVFASLVVGLVAAAVLWFRKQILRILKLEEPAEAVSYSQKLSQLTDSLAKSSSEVDSVLAELSQVAHDREKAVLELEEDLRSLESREKQLQQRIQDLENVPIPVAEHFAKLTASGERRSALRDYVLFGAGVVVSTVIAILLKAVGLG